VCSTVLQSSSRSSPGRANSNTDISSGGATNEGLCAKDIKTQMAPVFTPTPVIVLSSADSDVSRNEKLKQAGQVRIEQKEQRTAATSNRKSRPESEPAIGLPHTKRNSRKRRSPHPFAASWSVCELAHVRLHCFVSAKPHQLLQRNNHWHDTPKKIDINLSSNRLIVVQEITRKLIASPPMHELVTTHSVQLYYKPPGRHKEVSVGVV